MRPSPALLQYATRLTLFSRSNCSLCEVAKGTLSQLRARKPFEYEEVDVMAKGQEPWRKLYQFDTPVLHVQNANAKPDALVEVKKLMHRFSEAQVEKLMEEVETTA